MAGWAGHAGGGTDVRANRIFTGGGCLTERQHEKERERDFGLMCNLIQVSYKTLPHCSVIRNHTYECDLYFYCASNNGAIQAKYYMPKLEIHTRDFIFSLCALLTGLKWAGSVGKKNTVLFTPFI